MSEIPRMEPCFRIGFWVFLPAPEVFAQSGAALGRKPQRLAMPGVNFIDGRLVEAVCPSLQLCVFGPGLYNFRLVGLSGMDEVVHKHSEGMGNVQVGL